jgi:hypothetical protein
MFALVKFISEEMPVVFRITNSSYVKSLSTMADVEWVLGPVSYAGCVTGKPSSLSVLGEARVLPVTP